MYRYYANERELRDAVIARLEDEAGITLEGLALDDIAEHTARILEYVSSFPLASRTPDEPTLLAAHQRQRDVLVTAVSARTASWPATDRDVAAAVLDVLWSVASYERLVVDWGLDAPEAVNGVTWAIRLVVDAIKSGLARAPDLVERGDELGVGVERRVVPSAVPARARGGPSRRHRRAAPARSIARTGASTAIDAPSPPASSTAARMRGMLVIGSAASSPQGIHP